MVDQELVKLLRSATAKYPDFPKKGILFEDILPIFRDPELFSKLVQALVTHVKELPTQPNVVVGLESRGFLFGPALALSLGIGFVPVRKSGKLPGDLYSAKFAKEYGEDVLELQKSALEPTDRVLVVDDIIATGGSAAAVGTLVAQAGASVVEYLFLMELGFLNGRDKLDAPVHTLLSEQN